MPAPRRRGLHMGLQHRHPVLDPCAPGLEGRAGRLALGGAARPHHGHLLPRHVPVVRAAVAPAGGLAREAARGAGGHAGAVSRRGGDGERAGGRQRCRCGHGLGEVDLRRGRGCREYDCAVSPAKERGKFVTMNHVGFIAGLATGPQGEFWGWRVSILIQLFPAAIFAVGLPFLPRWLVEKGHMERARKVLFWLRDGTTSREAITHELHAISADVESRHASASSASASASTSIASSPFVALTLSLFREPALFARLWRAFLLQFMAQMCGATAMKYYLPALLKALGVETRVALMAGALEMTLKIGMTVLEMWVIDRFGRRACLVGGSLVMGVINGALPLAFPGNANKAADVVCIVFIFIYAMGYSLGLGPAIFPTSVRARGLNFAASGGSIGSIIVAQVWPVGLAHLGSGIYFFFMAVNFICVPVCVIWLLYPETKGRALEDMDSLFGKATDSQFHSSAYLQLDGAETGDEWAEDDAGREESPPGQEHEQRHARDSTEQEGEEDAPLLGR
ncbi:ascus development protein [Purpureocillium lilacinum]|uniref:Ascus development protein n=1 Tax=Purpureocillium lilacinum TaxID=33203 RepID=A0A179GLU6_PURLI|nr:ascus development protein [Purpureocillium lilacinum]